MSADALLLPVLTCAFVLLVSAVAKTRAPQETADAFTALRVQAPRWAPAALPWLEIALGLALLFSPPTLLIAVSVATLLVMLAYWLVIARALRFAEPVRCACFGRLGEHAVSRRTLVRNTLLVVAAALSIWAGVSGVSVLGDLAGEWAWVVLAALTAAVVTLSLSGGSTSEASSAGLAARHADQNQDPDAVEQVEDYVRHPIPYGQLRTGDDTITLHELTSSAAVLLVALSPGCGPCDRLAPDLLAWQDKLGGAVQVRALFASEPDVVRQLAPHLEPLALYDIEMNVSRVLRMLANPSAVLLGADGLLAGGPVEGEREVRAMVEDVLGELTAAGVLEAD